MLFSILLVVFVSLLFLYFRHKSNNKKKRFPSLKGYFLLGNLCDFLKPPSEILSMLLEHTKMYGTVFEANLGPFKKSFFVTDCKLAEHIFNSKFANKSQEYSYFRNWFGIGLFTDIGVIQKNLRELVLPTLHFSMLVQYIEAIDSVGNILIEHLEREVGKPNVDIYPYIAQTSLDVITETVLGTSVSVQRDETLQYIDCVKILAGIILQRTISPLHDYLYVFTPNYYKEKRVINILNAYTDSIIDRRIKTLAKDSIVEGTLAPKRKLAMVDLLLTATDQYSEPIPRERIRQVINVTIFGGFDTVASTLSFALYSLATHPHVQQKVVNEQKEIFIDRKNSEITMSDLQEMKYLECVIKETLRLYPAAPGIVRKFSEDFEWNGKLLPKNTSLIIFVYGMHRNPEYFQKPEEFIPERFENWTRKYPYSYIPFSAGPAKCIGGKFSMIEMKIIISKILRKFILSPATPEHVLKLVPETVLISQNGVRISLQKREEIV